MRGSEVVDLLSELLPRNTLRVLGRLLLLVLLLTGTYQAAILWYVQDKQEAVMEDVVGPMMERLEERLQSPAATHP